MMTLLIITTTLFTIGFIYFAWRAYVLAGIVSDQEEYTKQIESLAETLMDSIKQTYETFKEIDQRGSFESDDEVGTTFKMLKQTIDTLYEQYNETEKTEEE